MSDLFEVTKQCFHDGLVYVVQPYGGGKELVKNGADLLLARDLTLPPELPPPEVRKPESVPASAKDEEEDDWFIIYTPEDMAAHAQPPPEPADRADPAPAPPPIPPVVPARPLTPPPVPALRRSSRSTAGRNRNPQKLPQSVVM